MLSRGQNPGTSFGGEFVQICTSCYIIIIYSIRCTIIKNILQHATLVNTPQDMLYYVIKPSGDDVYLSLTICITSEPCLKKHNLF